MDGFGAMSELLGESNNESFVGDITEFDIDLILDNPYQPRKHIDEGYIDELVETIKVHGVMQPIVVRDSDDKPGYKILVAGQRRLKGARKAGLSTIPIITNNVSEDVAAVMSVVENLQRVGVPTIDTANALNVIKEKFGLKNKEIARSIGKTDKFVSDHLAIFNLPEVIFDALSNGKIESAQTAIELRKLFMLDEKACLDTLADSDFISYHEAVLLNKKAKERIASDSSSSCEDEFVDVDNEDEEIEEANKSKPSKKDGYSESDKVDEVSFTEEKPIDREESKEFQSKVFIVVEILRNLKDKDIQDIAETIVSRLLD